MPGESVTKLRQSSGSDLYVPDEQTLTIDPTEREWANITHHLQIDGFDDLRALHMVPERLEEEPVRQAIADDDAEARQITRRMVETPARGSRAACCETHTDGTAGMESYPDRLRRLYREIRPVTNVNLARVVGDALGVQVEPESPLARTTYSVATRYLVGIATSPLLMLLCKDIEIGRNATLVLVPTVKSLWANKIRIHVGGRLVINSGYIKIRASSVQGNIA